MTFHKVSILVAGSRPTGRLLKGTKSMARVGVIADLKPAYVKGLLSWPDVKERRPRPPLHHPLPPQT